MSSALAPRIADGVLEMPEPVGLQPTWLCSDRSKKVLRVGRRGAKTRFAFYASVMGHGPGWEEDQPKFKGILQGLDVVWCAQTYTNLSTVLWREEIIPRMSHLPWVTLNETKHDVNIQGLGSLMLRSADREAIDSIRGIGKRLGGVIIDEAAWLDLRGALQDVIMPALIDNDAWLILMSTTNAGKDGGYDDQGAPQVPSYFNVICSDIRAGTRSDDWAEFTGTAYDNPTLNPKAIDALIAEYTPDSPKLRQEVFAELLQSGVGLALPTLSADDHIVRRRAPASNRRQWGAFDWGFNHPWVFGWYEIDDDGNVCKIDTLSGREDLPESIAEQIIASGAPLSHPHFVVHAGHDIWQAKGRAVGYSGPTIASVLGNAGIKLTRAGINRVLGLDNIRRYIAINPVSKMPRFTLMDTDGNKRCLAQMQAMQLAPKEMEDVLKVDADSAGRGGDDFYDETRYGLMARPITIKHVEQPDVPENVSLGYDYKNHKVAVRETADEAAAKIISRAQPHPLAGRYRMPRR